MLNRKKRTSLAYAMIAVFALGLTACNTFEGAGKDVQSAGEAIEDAADDD